MNESESSNISIHPCDGSRSSFIWRSLWTTIRDRPRLILVGHPNFSPLGQLLARLSGAPLVVFIYGIDVWKPLPVLRRWSLQHADRIISISRFTADRAADLNGIPLKKTRILHNCLPSQLLSAPSITRNGHALTMLTVARLSRDEQYKGHDWVIRAMPHLLERFPGLVYHIVGDGSWRPDLEALAAREGVAQAVLFHGFVTDEMLACHYSNADLFIMPSRREGFGFVFLEAMANGIPAIGGNLDATPEAIVDGKTGYLIDPTSVESIVAAVSRLLGDEQLRRKMGQAAAQYVASSFNFDTFREKLISYLAELRPDLLPLREPFPQL